MKQLKKTLEKIAGATLTPYNTTSAPRTEQEHSDQQLLSEITEKESQRKFGHRQKQRFAIQKLKQEQKEWTKLIKEQEQLIQLKINQALTHIKHIVQSHYRFVANPKISTKHNAYLVLCEIPCWYYFGQPTNTVFHNFFKPNTKIPKNINPLLGLGTKFIQTLFFRTKNIGNTTKHMKRSLSLKPSLQDKNQMMKTTTPRYTSLASGYQNHGYFPVNSSTVAVDSAALSPHSSAYKKAHSTCSQHNASSSKNSDNTTILLLRNAIKT